MGSMDNRIRRIRSLAPWGAKGLPKKTILIVCPRTGNRIDTSVTVTQTECTERTILYRDGHYPKHERMVILSQEFCRQSLTVWTWMARFKIVWIWMQAMARRNTQRRSQQWGLYSTVQHLGVWGQSRVRVLYHFLGCDLWIVGDLDINFGSPFGIISN